MQKPTSLFTVSLLLVFSLLLSACQFNVSRSDDGSLAVETSISAQELQNEITAALADPLIKNLTVSLQSGYILVTGERERLNDSSQTDSLTFRLDLGVSNGQLTATIADAKLDGKALEQNRVDHWNQTIANRLQKINPKANATLQSVTVTTEAVSMTWKVTKK